MNHYLFCIIGQYDTLKNIEMIANVYTTKRSSLSGR